MLSEVRPTRAARGARSVRVGMLSLAAAAAIAPTAARAANVTFAPSGSPSSGTYASASSNPQPVTYYTWSIGASQSFAAYAVGDDTLWNQASGTYVIDPTTATLDPSSMTFTGGATYDFTKANATGGNNSYSGFAAFTVSGVTVGGGDSFGSSAITDANAGATTGAFNFTLGTVGDAFTGKVILRQAAANITSGATITNTVNSGTLEIHFGSALFASNNNSPTLALNGGTFAVNIDNGFVGGSGVGNTSASSSQLNGIINVGGAATVANNAVDSYGRARAQDIWRGAVNVGANTLTVYTGGGTVFGGQSNAAVTGTGTIVIGTDAATANPNGSLGTNRLRLTGNAAAGSATLTWDLGSNGIIENAAAANGTSNFGALAGQANTLLRGSTNSATAAASASTLSLGGAANSVSTFNGSIINGVASTSGTGPAYSGAVSVTPTALNFAPNALVPVAGRSILNSNVTKAGATSSLTLTGSNLYGGTTNVNAGTLVAQSAHALGDSAGNVTVASGATLDLQSSPGAGKQFVLNGGSLVNNGASAVTVGTGASANFANNATGGGGVWSGAGNTATVAFSAPNAAGGTQATGQLLLQLGSVSGNSGGAAAGSGYYKEPKLTFSDPDLSIPGARAAKAAVLLNNGGSVVRVDILDPGYGYTSVPTITVDSTGTGGSGFSPVFTMTGSGIRVTNAGSGYTSAPTLTFGGTGYEPSTAVGVGGFGSVTLAAASNVGGSGSLTINPGITGAFGLTKVGNGTTSLAGANAYTTTAVTGGTLATIGTGTLGSGDVTVTAGSLSIGNAASIADAAGLIFSPSASIVLAGVGGSEVLASITNSATNASITSGGVYTAAMLNSFFGVTSFSSLAGETVTIGTAIPEPVTLGAIAGLGLLVAGRRRRTA